MSKRKNKTDNSKRIKVVEIINLLISISTLLVALSTFVLGVYPELNKKSSDYLEKANAGDIESQIFLADYYYEVGDISTSIYWYKIAAMHDGEYKAKALNNLAYIYIEHGIIDENDASFYKKREASMLFDAMELGNSDAARNLFILLKSNPMPAFGDFPYYDALENAVSELKKKDLYTMDLSMYEAGWKLTGQGSGTDIPRDTEDAKMVATGVSVSVENDPVSITRYYTYDIYTREEESKTPSYTLTH